MNIGSLSLKNTGILAPLAGITNFPFRILVREFGCALAFTEMISVNGLVRESDRTFRYLDTSSADKPFGVQIFGSDPDMCAEAARTVAERGADLIDINMGCPARKVVKTGAGAALMKNPPRARMIMESVRKAVSLPLTVKMRSGWDRDCANAVELAKMAEDCGCDAVIVHPRTAQQGFSGKADWAVIGQVKASVKIPIIGNGDIVAPEDAVRMRNMTNCDAVMVGRGALGNPMIFRGMASLFAGLPVPPALSIREREALIIRHLDMELAYEGETIGMKTFRKHLLWYTKGLPGGARLRNALGAMKKKEAMLNELHGFLDALSRNEV
ncbi:MAG: tRNA dihydrouridine synthase DusB [Deltaproteobacteria bacterium]|nr:tRNA dihydrouridine synthase DusB [Deltaproteobacteria bacterium]